MPHPWFELIRETADWIEQQGYTNKANEIRRGMKRLPCTYIDDNGDSSPLHVLSLVAEVYSDHNGYNNKRSIEMMKDFSGFRVTCEFQGEEGPYISTTPVMWHNVIRYHRMNWDKLVMIDGGGDEYEKVVR